MWLKDPKTGKKSVTMTLLVSTFLVSLMKVLVAGMTLGAFKMSPFGGADFAAMVGSVGGIYGWRKMQDKDKDE